MPKIFKREGLRGVVTFKHEDSGDPFIYFIGTREGAFLKKEKLKEFGYTLSQCHRGTLVTVDVETDLKNSNALTRTEIVQVRDVDDTKLREVSFQKIEGIVKKTSSNDGYELTNEFLGKIRDNREVMTNLPDAEYVLHILSPPATFYFDPNGTEFSREYPFLIAEVPKDFDTQSNMLMTCEGIVCVIKEEHTRQVFIFIKGCTPYTEVLALFPLQKEVIPVGTFVKFKMIDYHYQRRAEATDMNCEASTLEIIDPPAGLSASFNEKLIVTLKDFETGSADGDLHSHNWLGDFDDLDRLLSPNQLYEEIQLEKVSGRENGKKDVLGMLRRRPAPIKPSDTEPKKRSIRPRTRCRPLSLTYHFITLLVLINSMNILTLKSLFRAMSDNLVVRKGLRGIVTYMHNVKDLCSVHLFSTLETARLQNEVIKDGGYRPKDIRLGDGNVRKISSENGYIVMNEVLGVIGDPNEMMRNLPDEEIKMEIIVPPARFYLNTLNPTTVFSRRTPFLIAMVPQRLDLSIRTDENQFCEGMVVDYVRDKSRNWVYIFTNGCTAYTDILALVPPNLEVKKPPIGGFVSFMMK
ncbi:unnamed protein product [Caenorhabditis auriculariae]|uniref:Uncharacterized protein n=1 Tax=Caenorhabditis auriculariae TaxID=2777116 RepID=A0A8S1H9B4_9PELO|nr:unnamed protein product [Caenorhabditis auriculariae]